MEESLKSTQDDSDAELDAVVDEIAEEIADSLSSRLVRWLIRTAIGLVIFGILWHFLDWAFWLFWGYVAIALISLGLQVYLHFKLANVLSGESAEPDG